jgi:hypothetical protein
LVVVLLAFLLNSSCAWWLLPPLALPNLNRSTSLSNIAHPVTNIPLYGPMASARAELSGVAWYGDTLILLPQYPGRFDQQLFALHKADIVDFLLGNYTEPLEPWPIPLNEQGVLDQIFGFNGYEAITFVDDNVYLTIETEQSDSDAGYLVSGVVAPDLSEIRLDPTVATPIGTQAGLSNMSDETIVAVGEQVATIYEANGLVVNRNPLVRFFDRATLTQAGLLPMPNIEYRITDATELDSMGRFWVINYFYPGDRSLRPILRAHGMQGALDTTAQPIERLLELQFTTEGVVRTDTQPIDLQLLDGNIARNWEGIVRLQSDGLDGFLLVTDSFPETILAFVPREP